MWSNIWLDQKIDDFFVFGTSEKVSVLKGSFHFLKKSTPIMVMMTAKIKVKQYCILTNIQRI